MYKLKWGDFLFLFRILFFDFLIFKFRIKPMLFSQLLFQSPLKSFWHFKGLTLILSQRIEELHFSLLVEHYS